MMTDEIIREARQVKDAIGKEHDYDLRALGATLRRRQGSGSREVVDLSHQKTGTEEHAPTTDGRTSQTT